jgi:hypothetical protein
MKTVTFVGTITSKEYSSGSVIPSLTDAVIESSLYLREPLQTAISGLKFGVKRGWYDQNMSREVKEKLLLERASYFSITLGIEKKSDAEKVMDKYWFIAPLDKIDVPVQRAGRPPRQSTPNCLTPRGQGIGGMS